MRRTFRRLDEPNMSDSSLLIKVEDLISMALGSETQNLVNFKHMQTVLFMLARQLRMLEQQVEIRMFESEEEVTPEVTKSEKKMRRKRTTVHDRKETGIDKKGKKQKDTDETDEDTEVSRRGTRKKTLKSEEKQKKETEKTPEKEKRVTAKDIKPTEREKSPGDKKARADKDISSSDKDRGARKVPETKVPVEKDRLTAIKEKAEQEKKFTERIKKQKIKAGISDSSIDYRDRKSRKTTGRAHVGNVEVVTQAEFSGLEAAVRQGEE
ncbi:PREDICTED: protein PXR1-like [Papilio polytes]|uniref:protein PXR1-like n=1 Tax=Papilio polytes TaxID=76194 RepID=UPI0006763455|nr:PREDICTED: protein PXR1-like [Papilio polytes]